MENNDIPEAQAATPTSLGKRLSLPGTDSISPSTVQDGNIDDNKRHFPEQPESLSESTSSSPSSKHDAEPLSAAPPVATSGEVVRSTTEQNNPAATSEDLQDKGNRERFASLSTKSHSSDSLTEDASTPLLRRSSTPPVEIKKVEEGLVKMEHNASTGSLNHLGSTESRSGNTSITAVDASSISREGSGTKLSEGMPLSVSMNDVHDTDEAVLVGTSQMVVRCRTTSFVTKLPKKKHAPTAPLSGGSVGATAHGTPVITLSAPLQRNGSDADSVASSTGKSAKGSDKKKHGRWYQSLYPTYKQRSEELKKLFPSIGATERLLVDYSCAMQKDILVQGRLYVSQYHICFYAKILAWETTICTPWKTVTALSKERTAKIIPNALSYTTDTMDQNYFTSFGQRDKTFTNLYRIWQGALKEQPMTTAEMWSFVHSQYGDELGLTSDDEDYVQPAYLRSYPEEIAQHGDSDESQAGDKSEKDKTATVQKGEATTPGATTPGEGMVEESKPGKGSVGDEESESGSDFVADEDDTSDAPLFTPTLDGQMLIDHEFRIPFDKIFLVLFSESTLLKEMFDRRKIMDTEFGQWNLDPTTDCQVRDVKYRISLGPKTIRTEEHQTLLKESVTGRLHLVDSVAQNHGAPYGDSFSVVTHYLLHKVVSPGSSFSSRLRVASEVVFRKVNWAAKAVLEKSIMDQLRDYMADLKGRLSTYEAELATEEDVHDMVDGAVAGTKRKPKKGSAISTGNMPGSTRLKSVTSLTSFNGRRSQRSSTVNASQAGHEDHLDTPGFVTRTEHYRMKRLLYLILILLAVNVVLYWRLWDVFLFSQDESTPSGTSCGEGAVCSRQQTVKAERWYWLIDKFSQPKNAPLLKNINDGLVHVLKGMQQISAALEELHSSLSNSSKEGLS